MESKTRKNKVCGVGVNDSKTPVKRVINSINWVCPFYSTWKAMLERCYSSKYQERQPTYKGCTVCDEWLIFSNFKKWMECQDWEGKQLDKDLLTEGNKIYSPENCLFIERKLNNFIEEKKNGNATNLIGTRKTPEGRFAARGINLVGKQTHLGNYSTELEAHKAWLAFKLEKAKHLAAEQSDPRVAKALIDRYENYVIN